jgi:hypothetical protein
MSSRTNNTATGAQSLKSAIEDEKKLPNPIRFHLPAFTTLLKHRGTANKFYHVTTGIRQTPPIPSHRQRILRTPREIGFKQHRHPTESVQFVTEFMHMVLALPISFIEAQSFRWRRLFAALN